MPITILDYVKSVAGEKTTYTVADFASAGVEMMGGCQICGATIAPYNAYPSTCGYWRCADCIGDDGFTTIEAFNATSRQDEPSPTDDEWPLLDCPDCGSVQDIQEIRDQIFECGTCGSTWRL